MAHFERELILRPFFFNIVSYQKQELQLFNFEELFHNFKMNWFFKNPLYFKILCLFEIKESKQIFSAIRCGKQIIEYNPDILEIWDEEYQDRMNKIVIIGKNMDKEALITKLDSFLDL